MADLEIITSITDISGAGFRLSLMLNAVGCEVSSSGIEIHSIARSVSLFSLMLKQIGHTLKEPQSIHSADALDAADEIKRQCELVFDEIEEMLDKVQKKDEYGSSKEPSLAQRFQQCFKKQRVQYLLAQLESLKLSLIVMLQILQLAKLLSPTHDPQEDQAVKDNMIEQQRLEVQDMVVVRYWSINRLDRLFDLAVLEAGDERDQMRRGSSPVERRLLAIEPPPDYLTSKTLVRLPMISLGELDASMNAIKESPKEMLRVSSQVIDPLLSRWTRLEELRGQARKGEYVYENRKFTPQHATFEHCDTDEEDLPPSPRESGIKGYYLEGTTEDWRIPRSGAAQRERSRLRKQYERLQAKVDSDVEEADSVKAKKKPANTYVVDSSDESEAEENPRRRRSSEGSKLERARPKDDPRRPHSYTPDTHGFSDKYTASPRASMSGPSRYPNARSPMQQQMPQRPMANPPQPPPFHHSISSPIVPYGQSPSPSRSPYSTPYPPSFPPSSFTAPPFPPPPLPYPINYRNQYHSNHPPPQTLQRRSMPPPLVTPRVRDIPQARPSSRHSNSSKSPRDSRESQVEKEKKQRRKDMRSSATKGLLAGTGIATFLEALEGLAF